MTTETVSANVTLSGELQRQRQILSVTAWCVRVHLEQSCSQTGVLSVMCNSDFFAELLSLDVSSLRNCSVPNVSAFWCALRNLHSCFNSNAWEQDKLLRFVVDQLIIRPCPAC